MRRRCARHSRPRSTATTEDVRHIANNRDPQIPEALAPVITGIVSLHVPPSAPCASPRAVHVHLEGGENYEVACPRPRHHPHQPESAFQSRLHRQGQTVVVIEDTNVYSAADWTKFAGAFGLSSYTSGSFVQVHPAPKTGNNCKSRRELRRVTTIDAEWASVPRAEIPRSSWQRATALNAFGGQILCRDSKRQFEASAIISMSYGDCRSDNSRCADSNPTERPLPARVAGRLDVCLGWRRKCGMYDVNNAVATHDQHHGPSCPLTMLPMARRVRGHR